MVRLAHESRGRPGREAISIRRNQDDPDNLIGDTRWSTRQHYDEYLAWRTQYTARFAEMLAESMLIRYFDEIPLAPTRVVSMGNTVWAGPPGSDPQQAGGV